MDSLHPLTRRIIENAGETTQSFGFGRIIGQAYALLYFSPEPLHFGQIQKMLGISKGSASMTLRQLQEWKALRKVEIENDRKDYYVAVQSLGHVIKRAVADTAARTLNEHTELLESIEAEAANHPRQDAELEHVKDRLKKLRKFHDQVRGTWYNPLVQRLLR